MSNKITWHTNDNRLFFDKPQEVIIEVTAMCNFDCKKCFNKNNFAQNGRHIKEMTTEYIKKIIDNISENNIKRVRFSGGEPLMRKDIFKLLAYAKSLGLEVWMNTNATLVTKDNIHILEKYVDNVLVSINGYDNESDFEWTQKKNSFINKIEGIKLLRKSLIKNVRSGVVATPNNIKNLEKIVKIIEELGIDNWEVFRPISVDIDKNNFDIEILYNKLISHTLKTNKWHPIANIIPFCCFDPDKINKLSNGGKFDDGHCRITIDPRGFAKPDYFSELNIGNPLDIMSCWNSTYMRKIRLLKYLPDDCIACKYKHKCKGGSRELSYQLTKQYNNLDPLAQPNKYINYLKK